MKYVLVRSPQGYINFEPEENWEWIGWLKEHGYDIVGSAESDLGVPRAIYIGLSYAISCPIRVQPQGFLEISKDFRSHEILYLCGFHDYCKANKRTLTPSCDGSNPSGPAKIRDDYAVVIRVIIAFLFFLVVRVQLCPIISIFQLRNTSLHILDIYRIIYLCRGYALMPEKFPYFI